MRGVAQSITVTAGRIGAALTSFVFPSLFALYGESFAITFLAIVAGISSIITFLLIPETKGKPLEETSREIQVLKA
ncbi:MFS transporter [Sulfolobus sp. E11-6]|nr:MFS transporter [Sulfolobus sp. E11-6]